MLVDTGLCRGGQPSNWDHRQQSANHVAKVTPNPGSSHAGRWQPQQHSTVMSSGEVSSAYSGPHMPPLPPPSPIVALGFNQSTFSYEELAAATDGFSHANLLGQGGFGYVHKGVLPNGKEIAVKQLKLGSGQGEREFQAEVDIISHIHHRHLVSLVGYCIADAQRMLVYEFVPNNSLEHHLHGKGLPVMDWSMRLKIALGSAKGIAYLHEDCNPRVIHRDIKSANILLDLNFEAMVSSSDDNKSNTLGSKYLAPEYASSGKLTEKSDVFSYGVMLLELITGRRPADTLHALSEDCLVDWARHALSRALADGDYDELADPRLDDNYDPTEMARMVAAAAASIRHSARRRPKMSQVRSLRPSLCIIDCIASDATRRSQIVRALEGDVSLEDLNEGMTPGHSMLFSSGSEYESSSYTPNTKRVRKVVIASPEHSGQITGHERGHSASSSEGGRSGELRSHLPP
ncbi:hypothetical protein GW17_00044229 [Ensete ventricosum]|nr:hypothetical protein GW17_00044229 [Ensete ventricosum]RZS20426.1 hypothetical protein BHM03_00052947 [Ensete ventricosum]